MTSNARGACVIAFLMAVPSVGVYAGDGPLPVARKWVPPDAVLVVEVARPRAVLDLLLGPKVAKLISESRAYQQAKAGPQWQGFLQLVRYLEMQLGTDWRKGVTGLVEGGATLAVLPEGGAVVLVDAADATILRKVNDVLLQIPRGEAAKKGAPDPVVSREVAGVTIWTLGDRSAHALIGKRLVWGNSAKVLEAVLELRTHPDRPGIDSSAAYQAARRTFRPSASAAATVFGDLSVLKKVPGLAAAIRPSDNPMSMLIFAGLKEALDRSRWASLELKVEGESLTLDAAMDGSPGGPDTRAAFMTPPHDRGALPPLSVPREILAMSLYRDLHAFYAAKDRLFPERTSGIIFFENMMGIFFSGRDLTGEVFGEMRPEVRFVMAAQTYGGEQGTPEVKIPAFALVLPSQHPDEFAKVAEEAWQKGVGLIAVTRGQRAEPGLIMDRVTHNGVKFTVANNAAGRNEDRAHLPSRFNFSPSLARVGDSFILSSTEGLTKDLIDSLKAAPAGGLKPLAGVHSLVEADGGHVAAILAANRETLVERNMVEKGNTRIKSESEIDMLAFLAKLVRKVRLTGTTPDAGSRYSLGLDLNLP